MPLGHERQVARHVGRGDLGERALGDAVLERVVGQDDDATAGRQDLERGRQGAAADAELVVDLDAQRLERPLGRVAARATRGAGMDVRMRSTSRALLVNGSRARSATTASAMRLANFSSPYSRSTLARSRDV